MSTSLFRFGTMSASDMKAYIEIIIDHTLIDETLTDFPLTVSLDSQNFVFDNLVDGMIYFTDMSDTVLDFEKEYFDATEQKAVFHVRVPSISNTAYTRIKLINGDTATYANGNNPTDVWDSGFMLVQHMGTSLLDSSGNGNDVSSANGTTVSDGIIGKCRIFDGSDDYLMISHDATLNFTSSVTITALLKASSPPESTQLLLDKSDGSPSSGYYWPMYP